MICTHIFSVVISISLVSNVYLDHSKTKSLVAAPKDSMGTSDEVWHGKCILAMEGRAFDAGLHLDFPSCKFGKQVCSFQLQISTQWDISVSVQEGWKNGTPLPDASILLEELKNFRTPTTAYYRLTATLPTAASLDPSASDEEGGNDSDNESMEQKKQSKQNNNNKIPTSVQRTASMHDSMDDSMDALSFQDRLKLEISAQVRAAAEAKKAAQNNKIPLADDRYMMEEKPVASTKYVLVVNSRNVKVGGPMRFTLSYYFDVSKAPNTAPVAPMGTPQDSDTEKD